MARIFLFSILSLLCELQIIANNFNFPLGNQNQIDINEVKNSLQLSSKELEEKSTLHKHIDTTGGFSGTWYQEPSLIDSTNAVPQSFYHMSNLPIVPNRKVFLISDDFIGSNITHSENGFLIGNWNNSNGVISFVPITPINNPFGQILQITISGSSSDCRSFRFFLNPPPQLNSPILLSTNLYEGTCLFTIKESEETNSPSDIRLGISTNWQLTIIKSNTGRIVYDSSVTGTSKAVKTREWSPGIYIATAQVEGQYLSCKFVVPK